MAITHIDSILGWHHIPQSITAQDDVAMPFGVKGHHSGIRLWRNHKLPTVEIVAPEITFQEENNITFGGTIKIDNIH